MAFNFNWSPLIADTSKARDMLTTALNKSPKPPIIVDDIIVNELNLGSVPPELEILEIGDLAEDRFRGIFRMSYTGDAYLTLKTRVQANPLNTYLSTKPSFASPQPLAASSGLTIPLQITLSDIRLSGFAILVFSRQKGITLVFRNDPLESLKVSSTFDSIPFVRNYLQKEIEAQLRVLFMDDLPAIIHRLSLRVWSPEHQLLEEQEKQAEDAEQIPIDPLGSWPNPLDGAEHFFAVDSPTDMHASFSQKNILRLAALTESQRTLSLFTPSIRDAVYRAWAGASEREEGTGANTPLPKGPTLSRLHSFSGRRSTASSAASESSDAPSSLSRPTQPSSVSVSTSYSMASSRSRVHNHRKRKHRTINLRKSAGADNDEASVVTEFTDSGSAPSVIYSEPLPSTPISEEPELELQTPSRSSPQSARAQARHRLSMSDKSPGSPRRITTPRADLNAIIADEDETPRPALPKTKSQRPRLGGKASTSHNLPLDVKSSITRSLSSSNLETSNQGFTGGILEQAWMRKVQAESKRRVDWEKAARDAGSTFWARMEGEDQPPPAYAV